VLFATEAGIDVKHVPYKGTGPLVNDLVGGHVEMGFLAVAAAAGHIKSGKLRAIGVSTAKRAATMPEVPTLAESGLPKYNLDGWLALIGPAGLPPAIVDRQMLEPSCGACAGCGPGSSTGAEQVTVSAINRNFPGRSGPGRVWLASPPTVAASAIAGELVSFDELRQRHPV
jgi:Tripartite tricarboxylate transporter family receptor/Aconitase family (aconitate hydratase)